MSHDPIEAAKHGRKAPKPVVAPAAPAPLPPVPVGTVVAAPLAAVPLVLADSGLYLVVKGNKNVSLAGVMTYLPTGEVIEAASYGGKVGLQRLLDQGIELAVAG